MLYYMKTSPNTFASRNNEQGNFLLSRDKFREQVLAHAGHKCCLCGAIGVKLDAHHLYERRLWPDGGYYLVNGASVCGPCHLKCESTEISVEEASMAMGWHALLLPEHLYADQKYDKWGNPILPDGRRLKGELADDESVQKVLALCPTPIEWTNRIKYPRSWHVPWSPGKTKDDRMLKDMSSFVGRRVVITIKLDGENTSMYSNGLHARSLDYSPHESRDWVKALWARICGDIPANFRLIGENLFARHSVEYLDLPSYFMLFSIWDGLKCLSWDETTEWAALLDLETVPVLYDGIWDEATCRNLKLDLTKDEGYVIRLADSFHYKDFSKSLAKYVRQGHVAGSHWKSRSITPNRLASKGASK